MSDSSSPADSVPVDRLLDGALRADPSGPFLTFYDDATGERIELSLTSLENWVAKTANLLVDELDLEPGDVVRRPAAALAGRRDRARAWRSPAARGRARRADRVLRRG